MTMPRHPPLSIKRNVVPLRGRVTPVYLYWYPVSSLRDRLNAACGQSLNSVVFLVILGLSLAFYSSNVYSFPFSSWKDRVSRFQCLFGPWDFFLLGGGRSFTSLDVTVLSLCLLGTQAPLDSPDGPSWGSPGFGNGNWLISSCATRFSTVALCFAAFVCFWYYAELFPNHLTHFRVFKRECWIVWIYRVGVRKVNRKDVRKNWVFPKCCLIYSLNICHYSKRARTYHFLH